MSFNPIQNPSDHSPHGLEGAYAVEWAEYFDFDPEVPTGFMRGLSADSAAKLDYLCKQYDIKHSWCQRSKISALLIMIFNETCAEVGIDPTKAEGLLHEPYPNDVLKKPHWSEVANIMRECEADY